MIVSWEWLKEYVGLEMSLTELTDRLTMSGLNLEGIEELDGDIGIDLEVTSNRADCLGHIGVAREIATLFDRELNIPEPEVKAGSKAISGVTSVEIECSDMCPRYIARMIEGVKVGPSPDWLQTRLKTLGIASINNVVDVTNYVLMECGQPLHAFDFDKLEGGKIVVRRACKGEKIKAIDQRDYELDEEMCVIADAQNPVAIAGVMGGYETEISEETTSVLIEVADFTPLAVRNTARKLSLHSDSSFRFERYVNAHNMDWASRRCCELILQVAGGELLEGSIYAGEEPSLEREPITLRFGQVSRILGIEIPQDEIITILTELGLEPAGEADSETASFYAPYWRRDLTREIDLIEEIARIHGYDQIPEDRYLPVKLNAPTSKDRTTTKIGRILNGLGFSEAITVSFTSQEDLELFQPRPDLAPLHVEHSTRKKENLLRQSIVPALLHCRRDNERHGVFNAELFEIAKVYLEAKPGTDENQVEPMRLSLVSGRSFLELKGVIQTLVHEINPALELKTSVSDITQFEAGCGAELMLNDVPWGWLGELSGEVAGKLGLRDQVCVAEVSLHHLVQNYQQIAEAKALPQYPSVSRDFNFALEETVQWEQLEETIRGSAGPLLEEVDFGSVYRGEQLEAGQKSYIAQVSFRSAERTLTGEEVGEAHEAIVAACESELGAKLR